MSNKIGKKTIAGFEILLLVGLSFAIAFVLSGEIGIVVAQTTQPSAPSSATVPTSQPAGVPPPIATSGEIFGVGSKSVLANGKVFEGVNVMRGTDGLHYANIKDVGPIVFDNTKQAWVTTTADKLPAGTEVSGTLSQTAVTPDKAAASPGILSNIFGGTMFGTSSSGAVIAGGLLSGLVWGAIVYGGTYFIAKAFGLNKAQAQSVALGAGAGVAAGSSLYLIGQNSPTLLAQHPFLFSGAGGLVIGVGVGAAIIILTYKKEKKEIIKFECFPWEAPTGGKDCEKCNDPDLLCSEYRCKSLGQACEIINAGEENEMCVWIHPDDVKAPTIEPWNEALKPDGLKYIPDNSISPPNKGVKIVKTGAAGGCLQAFTRLEFGIKTNEPAKCRVDYELKKTFGEMVFPFGNTQQLLYEHTQKLKVPNPFDEEENETDVPVIHNDGTYTLYTRCMDANGNGEDSAAFAFSFCVAKGPDTEQPIIEGTSIESGQPVSFGIDKVPIEVYVNEPAECRWSRINEAYENMENEMSCATETYQINANLNYVCSSELTGIKDRENNKFYFRCKDKPNAPENERNKMETSFPLVLKGTEELIITKVGPSGIKEGSTSIVTVELTAETAHGSEDGKATCYFTTNKDERGSYAPMFGGGSSVHNHSVDLAEGNYYYYFWCVDDGANSAESNTTFSVFVDTREPTVTRVYREADSLMIITDEKANCKYSLTSCDYNFNEGVAMTPKNPADMTMHYTRWDAQMTYYIKCEDLKGVQPSVNKCSIVTKGSEL